MQTNSIFFRTKAVAVFQLSVALTLLAAFSAQCADDPVDVVRKLIAETSKNSRHDRRALYNTLKLDPAEIAAANTVLAPDDFSSPTWCVASKVDGEAAVVSVITLKDNNGIDPDPCYLIRATNMWQILSGRTDIRAAQSIVSDPTMKALERLSEWYTSHKKALLEQLDREFEKEWKHQHRPSGAELRALQMRVFSKFDPNGYSSTTTSPFEPEVIVDTTRVIKLLGEGLSVDARNTNRFNKDTLLYFAVRNGATDTVKLLLEKGAQVDAKSSVLGKTALFQAAFDGRIDLVEILIAGGADVNALDLSSNNALREAILGKKLNVVSLLLEKGAKPNQRNTDGETMADLAKQHGTPQIKALFN